MIRAFYRNFRLLALSLILLVVWGMASFQSLPRQEDPDLVSRAAVVKTAYPGASAERVEALVTEVLESEIAEIEEVKTLSSQSRVGFSTVTVELLDEVMDAQPVWSKVRDEIDDATTQFPSGVSEPELDEVKVKAYTTIVTLTWNLESEPNYALLRRLGEELEVQMRGVEGTEEVETFGAPDEEIAVEIAAPELVAVGLSPQDLADRIRNRDAKVSAGQLRNPERNLAIELESELETLEQIRQIPIQTSRDGQFTRLGDIAIVERGIREPPTDLAFVSGKPAIALGVLMKSGLRIDRWSKEIQQELQVFGDRLPRGIELEVIFNQNEYVEERIGELIFNLVVGALLVVGVTFIGMGWRASLVVGMALPLSVCAVLGWMSAFGISVQQMSVTGLIIALGLLIDNAIVVVDEIQIELHAGAKPLDAVVKTVNYLRAPLSASTLTTVLTFLPIALLPGGAGEFVGSIALSVILALISSWAISLTILAALAGRMLGRSRENSGRPRSLVSRWLNEGISVPPLTRIYRWTLQGMTAKPLLAMALSFLLPLSGFILVGTLDEQFFPPVDRDQVQVEFEFSSDTAIAQTQANVLRARELMIAESYVRDVHWFVGESAPKFYYNFTGSRENQSNYAQALVQLESKRGVRDTVCKLQAQLDREFPAARILVRQLEQGPPFDAPIEMRIYGNDIEELRRLGMEMREILAAIPEVTHARDDLSEAFPKLGFYVDDERAQQAGLDNIAIARQLEAYLEGATGGSILEATENLPVRVRLTATERANLGQIASLDLRPQTGGSDREFRPNAALGEFGLIPELAAISRRDEQRVNTVQAFVNAGVLPSEVLGAFQEQLEARNIEMPLGYWYEFGGEQEESDQATGNLLVYVPLLAIAMMSALVLSLNSFRQAIVMGMVAIGAVGMVFLCLKLFDSVLGFMAIVGTMGLIGISLNDSIVVLSAFNEDEGSRRGDPKAIREVVVKATRHVLTTTVTTMAGFVPLLLGGDLFWRPLAIAIAGGIGGSSILAIYFVPAAYLLFQHRWPRWVRKLLSGKSQTRDRSSELV